MLELSRRQRILIEEDRYTDLLQLIAQKQQVLGGLTEIGSFSGGIVEHWRGIRDSLAESVRRECEDILAESEALMSETLENESVGTGKLSARRDDTQRHLKELGETIETRSGGNAAGAVPPPRFLDVSR